MSENKAKIFYSYSHKDEEFRDALETHLAIMKRQGLIEEWHDRKIRPGDDWESEIDSNIRKADIILPLVSSDFIASDYCYGKELRLALERYELGQARIVPIIIRPSEWQAAPIGQFQALPVDGKPVSTWSNSDEAWLNITRGLRKIVDEITHEKTTAEGVGPVAIRDLVMPEMERIENISEQKDTIKGLQTGFVELDKLTDGIHAGDVVIVAGAPLMGKSDLALNILSNVALTKSIPVTLFSLRLRADHAFRRLLSAEAGVQMHRLLRGQLRDSDFLAVAKAAGTFYRAPVWIDGNILIDEKVMRESVDRMEQVGEAGLVVIDGIEHMATAQKDIGRPVDVPSAVRLIKLISRRYNLPIILTVAASKAADRRVDKRPRLQDLGEWEVMASDVANIALLLYRDEVYHPNSLDKGLMEIIVAKNDYGAVESVDMAYLREYCALRNLYRE